MTPFKMSFPSADSLPQDAPPPTEDPVLDSVDLCRVRLVNLCAGIDGTDATPPRMAWYAIWARAFQINHAAYAGLEDQSCFAVYASNRAAIETSVHLRATLRPLVSEALLTAQFPGGQSGQLSESSWAEAENRLTGYLAWLLINEQTAVRRSITQLRDVFDPRPAQKLASDPQAAAFHRALFGSVPSASPADLRKRADKMRRALNERINQINEWLAVPTLAVWHDTMLKERSVSSGIPSLFEALGDPEDSIGGQLRVADLAVVAGLHSDGSSAIHGSAFNHLLIDAGEKITPYLGDPIGIGTIGKAVYATITDTIVLLSWVKQRLWA